LQRADCISRAFWVVVLAQKFSKAREDLGSIVQGIGIFLVNLEGTTMGLERFVCEVNGRAKMS